MNMSFQVNTLINVYSIYTSVFTDCICEWMYIYIDCHHMLFVEQGVVRETLCLDNLFFGYSRMLALVPFIRLQIAIGKI